MWTGDVSPPYLVTFNLFITGNTVLHILTLQHNKTLSCQIYDLIMSFDTKQKGLGLDQILNNEGLTPFKMAAAEGNVTVSAFSMLFIYLY